MAMNGLLVRVGIDQGCDHFKWNAPTSSDGDFAYVPIPERHACHNNLQRRYDEFMPAVQRLNCTLPGHFLGENVHLDPDFETLTFGDQGQRGKRIRELKPNDFMAFYAGLRSTAGTGDLVYALIGLFIVAEICNARDVPQNRWHENAHTRRRTIGENDVIVRALPGVSGRLRTCLPIGGYRDRAYRVTRDLLDVWGDLQIRNGYIQRSARLPRFCVAERFYEWFLRQQPELLPSNNPAA